ncbi:MAG: response regulator [Terriglobia bacterium]
MPVLVIVEDLIFLSKIQQTAKLVNAEIEVVLPANLMQRLTQGPAAVVICDLNYRAGLALEAIRELKHSPELRLILVIGFLSHVQADLATAAREAGCDTVMARSAFVKQLPQLLTQNA